MPRPSVFARLARPLALAVLLAAPVAHADAFLQGALRPDPGTVVAGCVGPAGEGLAFTPAEPATALSVHVKAVRLQPPAVGAAFACQNALRDGFPRPSDERLLQIPPILTVESEASSLAVARGERVNLVLLGADGRELARLGFTVARLGNLQEWAATCDGGPCRWTGRNTYFFYPERVPAFAGALPFAAKLRVVVTRGQDSAAFDLNR